MDASRIEMVLLGFILAKPGYAYEIDQYIEANHLRRWIRIGSASVYQGLDRLARKGLATARREKAGRMPVRRRYFITARGKAALAAAVGSLLSRCEDHYLDLNLALFCCHVMPAAEIPALLGSRLSSLGARSREIRAARGEVLDDAHAWQRNAILFLLAEFCQAELKTLRKISTDLRQRQGKKT